MNELQKKTISLLKEGYWKIISIEVWIKMYDAAYGILLHHYIEPDVYRTYIDLGESVIKNDKELIAALCEKREDYFMSDREVAALGLAVTFFYGARGYARHAIYGPQRHHDSTCC